MLEDIKDIKFLQIKGEMLFSETQGKPKDHYEILEQISSGELGTIKKVKNKISGCIRSMKVIKKAFIDLQEDKKNFMKEIAILRTLDHINIMKIFEFYQNDKNFYLITEHCQNGDLFEKVVKGPLSEYAACFIIFQVLSAIVYCHNNNIVHRDVKLDIIFIESIEYVNINGVKEEMCNVKLSDFSTARSFIPNKKITKKVGTPYYIAPEVLAGEYTEKCDIWSIGVLMFILLCGKPPFWGDSNKEILKKVKEGKMDVRRSEWLTVSEEAIDLIINMIKIDPNKRYSGAQCLNHIWFKKYLYKFPVSIPDIKDFYRNITNFQVGNSFFFQQASLAYMIHHMGPKDMLDEIKKLYIFLDKNGDGKMAYKEIVDGFKKYIRVNEKEITKVFKYIDQAHSGGIEFEEFCRACINKEKILSEENLRTAFCLFNKQDETQSISCSNFKSILGLQTKFSDKTWEQIIKEIDINGDGDIEFDEFMEMMNKFVKKEEPTTVHELN